MFATIKYQVMKLIGTNSLVSCIKYPLIIYGVCFILSAAWIGGLIVYHLFSGNLNSMISVSEIKYNTTSDSIINFHYPFSKMVLTTHNSTEGIQLALIGILSVCFILWYATRIISQLSNEEIFTIRVINDFKTLSFGLIALGIITLIVDLTMSINKMDFTPPFFYILIGLILSFIKEIFVKGKNLQEQTDLTI